MQTFLKNFLIEGPFFEALIYSILPIFFIDSFCITEKKLISRFQDYFLKFDKNIVFKVLNFQNVT